MTDKDRRCLAIVGPTASGKSRLGLLIAERTGGEIVSADSRQLYRYMDIGTAKPSDEERRIAAHHLIDIMDPDEECSAGAFARFGQPVIEDILDRGKLPVIVGGSGLYIDGLEGRIFAREMETANARKRLRAESAHHPRSLHERLSKVDPSAAEKIHPHDTKRLIRALEVHSITGRRISALQQRNRRPSYTIQFFGLRWDRKALYARIEERVDRMIGEGLVDEVRSLLGRGYDATLNAMDSIGYKEMIPVVEGKCELGEAVALLKRNTRRLAKKQMTWFRRLEGLQWLDLTVDSDWDELCSHVIDSYHAFSPGVK